MLAFIMIFGSVACSSIEPDSVDGWTKIENYLNSNGTPDEYNNMSITFSSTKLGDVIITLLDNGIRIDNTSLTENMYTESIRIPKDTSTFSYSTAFGMIDDTVENGVRYIIANDGKCERANITADTVFDFSMAEDTSGKAVVDDYARVFSDRIHLLIASLQFLIDDNNLEISLSDLGFTDYIVSTSASRQIILESLTAEASKVEPAPITIKINKVDHNSAGTTEAHVQFTNNSNKDLIVFNFYVRGYDAYGDIVKAYKHYDYTECYYDKGLAAGKTTPSDWYWNIFGAEEMVTIEVAVWKYKLAGDDTVEIPESQLKWVTMQ